MPLAYKDLPAGKASIKNIFTAEKKAAVNVGVYFPDDRRVKLCWSDGAVTEGEFTGVEGMPDTYKLIASDKAANDYFGYAVSISGDTVVVGANGADPGGTSDAGAAYVFTRSGATWTEQAKLVASDKAASDYFGQSVSVSGDTVVVGAYSADPGGTSGAGAAYTYAATVDGQHAYIRADNALTGVLDISTVDAGALYEYRGLVIEEGETLAVSVSYGLNPLQIQVRGFEE